MTPSARLSSRLLCGLRGALGAVAALVKGGHGRGGDSTDIFCTGTGMLRLSAPRIATTHGTGCPLSAAIAAGMAKGLLLREAKDYLHGALAAGIALCVGKRSGPVRHLPWVARMRTPPARLSSRAFAAVLGAAAALVKGGRERGGDSTDIFFDGAGVLRLSAPRIATPNTHVTGCTLSAAIPAGLAKGLPLREAKDYLHGALAVGIALCVGKGGGPVHHFHRWWRA